MLDGLAAPDEDEPVVDYVVAPGEEVASENCNTFSTRLQVRCQIRAIA